MKPSYLAVLNILRKALLRGRPVTIREVAESAGQSPRNSDWYKALKQLQQTENVNRAGKSYWIGALKVARIRPETICAVCRHLEATADERLREFLAEQELARRKATDAKEIKRRIHEGYRKGKVSTFNVTPFSDRELYPFWNQEAS